jgi:hypothetical protein
MAISQGSHFSLELLADIAGIEKEDRIHADARNKATRIIWHLRGAAAASARLCPSNDGCSIQWPALGVFCEVDKDAIAVQLFPVRGLRDTFRVESCDDFFIAATILNDTILPLI